MNADTCIRCGGALVDMGILCPACRLKADDAQLPGVSAYLQGRKDEHERGLKRIAELEAQLAEVLALADKWEREAAEDGSPPDQRDEGGTFVSTLLSVAAELRERAKERPCK